MMLNCLFETSRLPELLFSSDNMLEMSVIGYIFHVQYGRTPMNLTQPI